MTIKYGLIDREDGLLHGLGGEILVRCNQKGMKLYFSSECLRIRQ